MRSIAPLRVVATFSGRGSLSRILDWSFEGPDGAKLCGCRAGDADVDGDEGGVGKESPRPSPGMAVSLRSLLYGYRRSLPSRKAARGESSKITVSIRGSWCGAGA